jgi:hypothetical protein
MQRSSPASCKIHGCRISLKKVPYDIPHSKTGSQPNIEGFAIFKKHVCRASISAASRDVDRRLTGIILRIDVGTVFQQQAYLNVRRFSDGF